MVESAHNTLKWIPFFFMVPATTWKGWRYLSSLSCQGFPCILVVNRLIRFIPTIQLLAQVFPATRWTWKLFYLSLQRAHLIDILSENLEESFQHFPSWSNLLSVSWFPEWFVRRFFIWLAKRFLILSRVVDEAWWGVWRIHLSVQLSWWSRIAKRSWKGWRQRKERIGTMARRDIELMLGDKGLWNLGQVKNWRDKSWVADFGYNEEY